MLRTLEQLHNARETLLAYLKQKVEERDWHGVADAAMDLRELEVEHTIVREAIDGGGIEPLRVLQNQSNRRHMNRAMRVALARIDQCGKPTWCTCAHGVSQHNAEGCVVSGCHCAAPIKG